MTNEERDLIEKFFARVGGASQGGFASVPGTQPNLPAVDTQADQLIAQEFEKYPEARYRVTQMAVVQEVALVQAQNRIQQLQAQLQQAQQALQAAQQQAAPQKSGGFLGGLFGGGQSAQPQAAPPPGWGGAAQQMPPPMQAQPMPYGARPSMFQGGSGFLGSALTTATGVAGGMLAANALTGLFSGHHDMGGSGFGSGVTPGSETIINNDGDNSDPFGGAGTTADQDFSAGGDSWGDSGGDWGGDDQSF